MIRRITHYVKKIILIMSLFLLISCGDTLRYPSGAPKYKLKKLHMVIFSPSTNVGDLAGDLLLASLKIAFPKSIPVPSIILKPFGDIHHKLPELLHHIAVEHRGRVRRCSHWANGNSLLNAAESFLTKNNIKYLLTVKIIISPTLIPKVASIKYFASLYNIKKKKVSVSVEFEENAPAFHVDKYLILRAGEIKKKLEGK